MSFSNPNDSHTHSLEVLNELEQFEELMISISNVLDIGCGKHAKDLLWWANASIEDDNGNKVPLNIKCYGIDLVDDIIPQGAQNIIYTKQDFEEEIYSKINYDVLWSHDSFQYATNPINTLRYWSKLINEGGMLVIQIPTSVTTVYNKFHCSRESGIYFNHTVDSLMQILALNGFDCSDGYFQENNGWIRCVVYKSDLTPMDPRTTTWYNLADTGLLPDSAVNLINKYGYVKREELVLSWISGSNQYFGI